MKNYVLFGVLAAVALAVGGLSSRSADANPILIQPECVQSDCQPGYVCGRVGTHEACVWSGSCPSGYYQCPGEEVCMPDGLYCRIQ